METFCPEKNGLWTLYTHLVLLTKKGGTHARSSGMPHVYKLGAEGSTLCGLAFAYP